MTPPALITYPARPYNGGPFTPKYALPGSWRYEPKFKGWRALVHVESATMFDRHGKLLSIVHKFTPVLERLRLDGWTGWLDCQALESHHGLGKGSLVILDWLIPGKSRQRRWNLLNRIADISKGYDALNPLLPIASIQEDALYVPTIIKPAEAPCFWKLMQEENSRLGIVFYEGFIAKDLDSIYPIQLCSATQRTASWIKHQFPKSNVTMCTQKRS